MAFPILMTDLIPVLHFLTLVGLTGAAIEDRIASWPQWTVPLVLTVFLALTVVYAGLVGLAYS